MLAYLHGSDSLHIILRERYYYEIYYLFYIHLIILAYRGKNMIFEHTVANEGSNSKELWTRASKSLFEKFMRNRKDRLASSRARMFRGWWKADNGAKSFTLHSRRRSWKIEATLVWLCGAHWRPRSAAEATLEDSRLLVLMRAVRDQYALYSCHRRGD